MFSPLGCPPFHGEVTARHEGAQRRGQRILLTLRTYVPLGGERPSYRRLHNTYCSASVVFCVAVWSKASSSLSVASCMYSSSPSL